MYLKFGNEVVCANFFLHYISLVTVEMECPVQVKLSVQSGLKHTRVNTWVYV